MKKIFGICICLVLLIGSLIVPTAAFAASNSANNSVTIHFLNPTAIAVAGDSLFVADNVDADNNKSVILTFTLGDNNATYRDTIEIDGNVTNLSVKGNDGIYAILSDRVLEYTIGSNAKLTFSQEYAEDGELYGFIDCVYGSAGYGQSGKIEQTEYFLTQEGLYRNNANGWTEKFNGAQSAVTIGDNIYYMYIDNGGKAVSKRYNGRSLAFPQNDVYNNKNGLADKYSSNQPMGLFVWGEYLGVFWNNAIHYVEIGAQNCDLPIIMEYGTANGSEETLNIKDVTASDGRLFVLNDKNLVEVYDGTAVNTPLLYSVGSDTVDQAVPHSFNSFTMARSKGYPSNLVFKTNDENTSIAELITDAEEYIVLGYEGDEDSLYYYVLTADNHFGWVQKTNYKKVNGKLTDDKLEIIDTEVSRDSNVQYVTKFASLNAVYIYNLPRNLDDFRGETFQQTASTMPEVTVIQRFTEGDTVWYYVSFEASGTTRTGFVQEQDLGEFAMKVNEENLRVIGDRKINSTLFEAVKLYLYPDKDLRNDDNLVTTENGTVKLYSGKRVTVISEDTENGVAFIQIQGSNGSGNIYGYVEISRLIGVHAMTTNAIVGLSLLAAAIVLATTLIVVFLKRRNGAPKRKKDSKSE
ncbi:MAG: hypothetical protein J1F66_04345 [Clostridiales bacterium]|nr:hypothetical protein [Clostridiales bacterium]